MTVTRNTGSDILSLGQAPSYPRPRKQAIKAMRNAQAWREREDAQRPYDADRLARNLADRPPDVRVNDSDDPAAPATREYLRNMGWTDERLAAAQEGLREQLARRVHLAAESSPWRCPDCGAERKYGGPCPPIVDGNGEHPSGLPCGDPEACPECGSTAALRPVLPEETQEDLQGRVHLLTGRPSLTAGGGRGGASVTPQSRPSPAVAPRRERTWGEAQVARFGVVYPRSTGSPRSGRLDRSVPARPGRLSPSNPASTATTPQPANRRAPGGRAMWRTVRG
jgi:hypothetical protein